MSAAPIQYWTEGMQPEAVSAALFDGRLIAFRGVPAVGRLTERVRAIVAATFGADPDEAEGRMTPGRFRGAAGLARLAVTRDAAARAHWRAALAAVGYRPQECLGDQLRLRIVPSRETARSRRIGPLPPHRDSCGSGLMAQVNWWLPLYPLSPSRTMLVWPEAFRRRIANTSAGWDFHALVRDGTKTYPLLPVADGPAPGSGRPVLIEPDTLLAFSAAQLHGSASDGSGRSRISLDTRTVWAGDLDAGRGAPDVDGGGAQPRWEWFSPLVDGGPDESVAA